MKQQRLIWGYAMIILIAGIEMAHPVVAQVQPSISTLENGELAEAKRLNQQVIQLSNQGKYDRAIPLAKSALVIREKALGKDHPDVAQSLNNLAELYRNQGKYAQAEPLYLRALAIYEKVLGKDHPSVTTSLNNLAELYRNQGKYAQAEPLYLRALAINEKALGKQRPSRCCY
jgi:tetratricopeptide (TPR) repeat protein